MKLVAKRRAFYGNRLIERGEEFEFAEQIEVPDPDDPKKKKKKTVKQEIPSWAAKPGEDLDPEPKGAGDTKPADAKAAVAHKARGGQASME